MIVTCNNCKSAFTVNDEKVQGKKFAFNCPKCNHNNIINMSSESVLPRAVGALASGSVTGNAGKVSDDSFFDIDDDHGPEPESGQNDNDFMQDDATADEDLSFSESGAPADDDFEDFEYEDEIEPEIDLSLLTPDTSDTVVEDDPAPAKSVTPAPKQTVQTPQNADDDEDDIMFDLDAFDDDVNSDVGVKATPKSSVSTDDLASELDTRDLELSADSDLEDDSDQMTHREDSDLSIDLDSLDLDLEQDDLASAAPALEIIDDDDLDIVSGISEGIHDSAALTDPMLEDESLSIDMDSLDIDLNETGAQAAPAELDDESLSIDLDSLDIDLDDIDSKQAESDAQIEDEALSIDLDSLEIDLDDQSSPAIAKDEDEDETLSIDLDSLDIDLEEPASAKIVKDDEEDESLSIDLDSLNIDIDHGAVDKDHATDTADDDEKLSIDLDSLDIDLESDTAQPAAASREIDDALPFDIADSDFDDTAPIVLADDDIPGDLDINDLDTDDLALDIDPEELGIIAPESDADIPGQGSTRISRISKIDEASENDDGIFTDELELDDADDDDFLQVDEDETIFDDDEINIDDLDIPGHDDDFTHAAFTENKPSRAQNYHEHDRHMNVDSDIPLSDISLDAMPEVDLEKLYEEEIHTHSLADKTRASIIAEEELLDLDTPDVDITIEDKPGVAGGGYINFSVDYTLKYSRLRAFVKLIGLYYIALIPHFIVLALYSIVSSACGLFNNLIALFNGTTEADFTRFQEKTLRYWTGLFANVLNVIEERPPYAGEEDVDTAVQLQAYPPIKFSRFLAFMRLTGIGIWLLALPHLIILAILTVALVPFTLIGLLSTVIAARCPAFLLDYTIRYLRYIVNVHAYISGVIDAYPSFRFD